MNIQRRWLCGLAVLTLWYTQATHALGLGELTLQSALNQPLQAIIHLHDSDGLRPSEVMVTLADAEAFSRMGMERPFFLTGLRFTPVLKNRQLFIRVESSEPVREPYLSFLVQLKRANGSLMREYTLLLDPPLYKAEPIMASAHRTQTNAIPPTREPQRFDSRPVPARPVSAAARPQPGDGRYHTVSGDSLWAIANATRDKQVSVQQQMDAIGVLNPHAFVQGDLSRLRVGQVLTLPAAQQVVSALLADDPVRMGESSEPATSAFVPPESAGHARLRIDDLEEPRLSEQEWQLHERLMVVEKRLRGLLGELERRDAQIAAVQAELGRGWQANSIGQSTQAVGTEAERAPEPQLAAASASVPVAELGNAGKGVVERPADGKAPQAQLDNRLKGWWPVPVVVLGALFGALFLRSRRGTEQKPLSRPTTEPGKPVADPLKGVELYLPDFLVERDQK